MIDNYDLYIIFFTFCPSFSSTVKKSDKDLGMRLSIHVKNKNRFKLLDYYMPGDTLGLMGDMDLFIGMRYHSQVFAHKQGIQLIGLVYDDKCRRFLNENRLEGIDISEAIDYPEKFKMLISNRLKK